MKNVLRTVPTVLILLLYSFTVIADVFALIGINQKNIENSIFNNLTETQYEEPIDQSVTEDSGGNSSLAVLRAELKEFKIPKSKAFSTLTAEQKKTAALELCEFTKKYVNSPEFIENYARRRAATKPTSEPYRMSKEEMANLKSSLSDAEKQMAQAKKSGMLNAEQIKQMNDALNDVRNTIKNNEDPTPNKTLWNKRFPEDPAVAVKNKLQEYLAISSTVDFNATLTGTGKNQKFTNPEYEKKGLKWKAIYRAGKEVNTVTTTFVKEWLNGTIIDKNNLKSINSTSSKTPENTPQTNNPEQTEREETKSTKKGFLQKMKEKVKEKVNEI